jgi:hypothetical protein
MGAVKQWQMQQAERAHEREILDWYYQRTRRRARKVTARMIEDYELSQAFEHAVAKDD